MDTNETITVVIFVLFIVVLIVAIRAKSETDYDKWFEKLRELAFQNEYSDEDIEYWETIFFFYDEFINEVTPEELLTKIKNHAY